MSPSLAVSAQGAGSTAAAGAGGTWAAGAGDKARVLNSGQGVKGPERGAAGVGEPDKGQGARFGLRPVAVLAPPSLAALPRGLPAPSWGSDHICLLAEFQIYSFDQGQGIASEAASPAASLGAPLDST